MENKNHVNIYKYICVVLALIIAFMIGQRSNDNKSATTEITRAVSDVSDTIEPTADFDSFVVKDEAPQSEPTNETERINGMVIPSQFRMTPVYADGEQHTDLSNISKSSKPKQDTSDKTYTVYVTSKGEKYHRASCRYVKGKTNVEPMTVEEAIADGKDACSVCNP